MIGAIKKRDYSCWIDPHNQVRSQSPAPHEFETLTQAYLNGYVKVCYKDGAIMSLSGTLSALRHSRNRWIALATSISTIELNLIESEEITPILKTALVFKYPAELSEIDDLITI